MAFELDAAAETGDEQRFVLTPQTFRSVADSQTAFSGFSRHDLGSGSFLSARTANARPCGSHAYQ